MKLKLIFLLISVAMTLAHSVDGQSAIQSGFKNWYIGDFKCGVYVPAGYDPSKKYPLVLYLHGANDTISRDSPWYHEPIALGDPAIVLTPKCPSVNGTWGSSSGTELSPMMKKAMEMMDIVRKKYNVDANRIYIYGISMGGIGTYAAIRKYPDLFAAGYSICGWADPVIAPQLSKIPFWAFHGEIDDVVTVEGSRQIYNAVLNYGGKRMHYTEFKGVKHNAWEYVNNKEIIKWTLAQRKGK